MDSSTEQATGGPQEQATGSPPLDGAAGPEVTPLRRTPAGAPAGRGESVSRATPETPVMPPAAAAGDGEEEFVVRRRPVQRRVSVPTATDFTSERLLRPRAEVPRSGLRRAIYRLSRGRVNLGPSAGELAEREMVARAKARVAGCRRIAVMSRKGGVGKTTTTLQLGHTFASHRGDRVIAADGNPDAGSLAYRVRRETSATITDLLRDRDAIARYADIRAYTSQAATRLEVVAADDDPSITEALREQDFYSVVDLLEHHYNLVLLDTGTGVLESATKGIVALADQLVVVSGASLDTARTAMSTLDWLAKHGHTDLVANAVAVINQVRPDSQLDLDRVQQLFAQRVAAVVRIPWDAVLETGAEASIEDLAPATRQAYLQLAAAVADGFDADKPQRARPRHSTTQR
jgi:putative peptide zinc metalloprotease protein